MAEQIPMPEADSEDGVLRQRHRKSSAVPKKDRQKIAMRVINFAQQDETARSEDRELRLQRYAKFRMWTNGDSDFPWEGSSDVGIPMLMTDVLSVEDSLHNAVMSNRPITSARALKKNDEKKQELVDDHLDTQVFVEQKGEVCVGESASCFVMDGVVTIFTPWVREDRKVSLYKTFDSFKDDMPRVHFERIINEQFRDHAAVPLDESGWDWRVSDPNAINPKKKDFDVKFYTDPDTGEIEMTAIRLSRVYDGPKIIVKDYEDVLTPPRSANLQPPGPSNPGGAAHVILVDYPTIDEVERLVADGSYDMVSEKDLKRMRSVASSKGTSQSRHDEEKHQKDVIQGETDDQDPEDEQHRRLTRYLCFDLYDIDKSGLNTDMMWWVIYETETLCRSKPMTELYPCDPPRRPLAEASFIPVKGRREGISLLEMMESMHDFKKQIFDQVVDAGTLANLPFGFYRATSNIKPEVMRMWPGDLFPLSDPKNDVFFPNIGSNNATSWGINMMSIADQMTEKLTVQGDLQRGRVPVGRSSALRTSGNMQSLLQMAEARPERILRRFLMCWIEVFKQIHEMNQPFLPEEKKFRIVGIRDPKDDPYRTIDSTNDVKGRFDFDFSINVLNASKLAQQEGLEKMAPFLFNPMTLQTGITDPNTMYRWLYDYTKALGFGNGQYINQPSPDALKPPILVAEALTMILQGEMPEGMPMEGAQAHLQGLIAFAKSPAFVYLDTTAKVEMFRQYRLGVAERTRTEALAQAAAQQTQGLPGGGGAPGGPPPAMGNPQISGESELLDETLPGAGGGANGGMP